MRGRVHEKPPGINFVCVVICLQQGPSTEGTSAMARFRYLNVSKDRSALSWAAIAVLACLVCRADAQVIVLPQRDKR